MCRAAEHGAVGPKVAFGGGDPTYGDNDGDRWLNGQHEQSHAQSKSCIRQQGGPNFQRCLPLRFGISSHGYVSDVLERGRPMTQAILLIVDRLDEVFRSRQ